MTSLIRGSVAIGAMLTVVVLLQAAPPRVSPQNHDKYRVAYPTHEGEYHILYRGSSLDSVDRPVSIRLGTTGPIGEMVDSVPMKNNGFYRVLTLPVNEPLDTDGDGYSDIYELENSSTFNPLNPGVVEPEHGSPIIQDRLQFESLSRRDNVPGAANIRETKFLLADVDTDHPKLYFINTTRHIYHYYFAYYGLGIRHMSLSQFNAATYFTDDRTYLAGSLLAHDNYTSTSGRQGIYTVEFWPSDPVAFRFVEKAYELISASIPFAEGNLAYHAAGDTQQGLYEEEKHLFDASHVRVIDTEDLFGNQTYSALNPGFGYGRLIVVGGAASTTFSARDVVIFRNIPNDLSHVAGIITEIPQTPLSHINLKARQNKTPNAYIKNASTDPAIADLIGKYVYYEVTSDGYRLEEATSEEVDEFLESVRPKEPQTPDRDLSEREFKALGSFRFAETDSYGAKATNVNELRKILPKEMTPAGFAIPFVYYHEFMEHNDLYTYVSKMRAIQGFHSDPELREFELEKLREFIEERAAIPEEMEIAFNELHSRFPEGAHIRCRSSTNNEDLPEFNGAGLYDSYTHKPSEGPLSKTIRQVWAGMWNYRAYEEREFYRIDHFAAAMGVLLHPNYKDELANGVAVTKNIIDPNWVGYYVNVQVGEDLVTNPTADAIPDEFLVSLLIDEPDYSDYQYEIQYVRKSNRRIDGQPILTKEQIHDLASRMQLIQTYFKSLYKGGSNFAMEIEFKIEASGQLLIKQARPWID